MEPFLKTYDDRLRRYAPQTVDAVGLTYEQANSVASTIYREVSALEDVQAIQGLTQTSPISATQRLFFFENYLIWKHHLEPRQISPTSADLPRERMANALAEACSVIDLYACFVFVGDGLFQRLASVSDKRSCTGRCALFLRNGDLRALRNAVAHGNWHLVPDGSIRYWAHNGADKNEPLGEFSASADVMNFYLLLSQCVAMSSLAAIDSRTRGGAPDLDSA